MSIGMALGGRTNFAGSSCGHRGSPENRCPQSFNLSLPAGFGHSARILAAGWAARGRRAFSYGRARPLISRHRLMQRDLKRLLAYSTIENAGIVFVGLGFALAFEANGMAAAAALAFTAALSHALNHSLFKSLLFFGAGAVLNTTGRVTCRVSGAHPYDAETAFLMLGGCRRSRRCRHSMDFVSDGLVFQAICEPGIAAVGTQADGASGRCDAGVGGGPVRRLRLWRAYGIAFLGRPGSAAVTAAVETDGCSRAAMGALLTLCLLLGIISGIAIDAIAPVTQLLVGQSIVPMAESRSSYNGLLVFIFITISTPLCRDHPPLRLARGAPRSGMGLRLPRTPVPAPNTPPAALPSRSAASSARWFFGARARRHARCPEMRARAAYRHAARPRLGCALRAVAAVIWFADRKAQPPAFCPSANT